MAEIWKALGIQGHTVTTVIAESMQEAIEEVERQLTQNPSRLPYHRSWVMGRRRVVLDEFLGQAQAELRFRYKCWEALWTSEHVRYAAEQLSEELFVMGKRLEKDSEQLWEYRMKLVKLAEDLW